MLLQFPQFIYIYIIVVPSSRIYVLLDFFLRFLVALLVFFLLFSDLIQSFLIIVSFSSSFRFPFLLGFVWAYLKSNDIMFLVAYKFSFYFLLSSIEFSYLFYFIRLGRVQGKGFHYNYVFAFTKYFVFICLYS